MPGDGAGPELLASFPSGTFLENLEAQADGGIWFTSYLHRELHRWSPEAGLLPALPLPAHPTDLVSFADARVVAAHGKGFREGEDFVSSMRVLVLAPDGTVRDTIPAPDARFFNGVERLDETRVLIADSLAGTIWVFDRARASLAPWLTHDTLAPHGEPGGFALGANGVKRRSQAVWFSNTSTKTLFRVAIDGQGHAAATPEAVATFDGIDDFTLAPDGSVYVATHRNDLHRRDPAGQVSVLADRHCEGATAVAIGRGPSAGFLFATTTGGLFAGLKEPAHLLRLPLAAGPN